MEASICFFGQSLVDRLSRRHVPDLSLDLVGEASSPCFM